MLYTECLDWPNKVYFHIARYFNATHNLGPKLKRRCLEQKRIERHIVKIIVQEGATPAVPSIAGYPYTRATLAPVASAPDVPARWVSEEDVGTFVSALRSAFQSSTGSRKRGKISIVVDRNQHVCVFRIFLAAC